MTSSANPPILTSLVTGSPPGQNGSATSGSTASSGASTADSDDQFFNILQSVKVQTSSESGLNPHEEQGGMWTTQMLPGGLHDGGKLIVDQPISTSSLAHLSGIQQDTRSPSFTSMLNTPTMKATGDAIMSYEGHLDQGLMELSSSVFSASGLPVTVPVEGPVQGGSSLPVDGKGLPELVTPPKMLHRDTKAAFQDSVRVSHGTVSVSDDGQALLTQPRELPAAFATSAISERLPNPEFVLPMAKMPGTKNGPGFTASTSVTPDISVLASDGDPNASDVTRSAAALTLDKLSAIQQTTTLTLPRPAGTPGWDQGLGQRVLWMVENGLKQAELRLDPPNLGSVSIRISMLDDQAQLMLQAANPAAREALESALPKLREMFNQQGLTLGDADVSDQQAQSNSGDNIEQGAARDRREGGEQLDTNSGDSEQGSQGTGSSILSDDGGRGLIDEFV